jgi:phosphate-selective porin
VSFQNKTQVAIAALIALSGATAHAQSNSGEVQSLKNTVEELRRQVEELRSLVKQGSAAPAPQAEGESQENVDARTPASRADIQGLRTDLENYKYDQSRLQERNIPSVLRNTRIGGSVTLGYDRRSPAFQVGDSQTTAATAGAPGEPRKSGFRAPGATLTFAGNLYRDYAEGKNLTYRVGLNVGTTPTNPTNNSQVNLTDAWARYSFQPSTGNLEDPIGTITLGQQAVPFGLDAPALDPEVRAVINPALFVNGLGLGDRQVGLLVQGDYDPYVDFTNNYRAPLLQYSLGFFNGNGPNKNDNNSNRDWIARVAYTLPVDYTSWLRQLQFGVSLYKRNPTIATSASPTAVATSLVGRSGEQTVRGFDINWTHLPFSIAYEWAYGKTEIGPGTTNATTLAELLKVNPDGYRRGVGQYINLGYTFGEQFLASSRNQGKFDDFWPTSFQAFVRADTFDPNRADKSRKDRQFRTTVGLNVFFAETTRFQINYFRDRNQNGVDALLPNTTTVGKRANGVQAQLVAAF